MSKLVDRQPDASDYAAAVERAEEMARFHARARARKSLLIFGPPGVGKTRLLQEFAKIQPFALCVRDTSSPRELALGLVAGLSKVPSKDLRLPRDPEALSTSSLKGMVHRALDTLPSLMILDQLSGPSRVLTHMIKDLNYYDRTPVFFVARTPHMGRHWHVATPLCGPFRTGRSEKPTSSNRHGIRAKRS